MPGLVWGKERGLPDGRVYPLECHLIDVGVAAEVVVTDVFTAGQRRTVARSGVPADEVARVAALLGSWHDVGKATPGFQSLRAGRFAALTGQSAGDVPPQVGVAHADAGFAYVWQRASGGAELNRRVVRAAQTVGGHHGVYPAADRSLILNGFGDAVWLPRLEGVDPVLAGRWGLTRDLILSRVEQVLFGDHMPSAAGLSVEAAALLTGAVVVADWLMSQVDVIAETLPFVPGDPVALTVEALRRHAKDARGRAERALAASGLPGALFRRRPFSVQFPGFAPRGPQIAAAQDLPALATGAGIFVVMAPTGDGKTEAALHAASVLAEKSGSTGVFLALPTMATTNAMYSRVREFVQTGFTGPTRLSLMHGLASLNDEYLNTERPTVSDESEPDVASSCDGSGLAEITGWMRGSNRPILAPNSVGTIDQLLAMALRSKWQPLRLLGVTRKVVVVDEAHAYDAYMQSLLRRVLTWLASCGVPVVLLSATLSARLAESLVLAYRAGVPGLPSAQALGVQAEYPGWVHLDAVTGHASAGAVPTTARAATVRVRMAAYDGGTWARPSGLPAAVLAEVGAVALGDADGNVLVVCNTVHDAVAVYDALIDLAAESRTDVRLMHARFPVKDRNRHAREVTDQYGKHARTADDNGQVRRPTRSILVATQVVEQSLDIDMDLIVSDLAPSALLIQRAGRGHRHHTYRPTLKGAEQPVIRPAGFTTPTMAVLVPTADGGTLADRDERPYDQSLLAKTYDVLTQHLAGQPGIRVPEDVQTLVDAVYDSSFTSDDEARRTWETAAAVRDGRKTAAADLVAIPAPAAVQDLHELTSVTSAEDLLGRVSARYDLNTVTILPTWADAGGRRWLDRDYTLPLPAAGSLPDGRHSREQLRTIIEHTIRVPAARWVEQVRDRQDTDRPTSWQTQTLLGDVHVISFQTAGDESLAYVNDTTILLLSGERGLRIERRA
ncbi:CRISPR-associated endonuclease Cas3'' [Actinoplanes sp. NPDC049596]|uniref:CRISPR-associated endonuclease Cas3'' n=1 Tax=unclassified Actinoplanes TaxID=2626549 RepID=UPI0034154361